MNVCDKSYTREQILERVGRVDQIGGTRHTVLSEGSGKGTAAIEINTGAGLCFTVLPDRGLDISRASYKGINLVYQTPNGEVHPAFYEPEGAGWLRTFFGGLLTTCGMTYLGHPGTDGEEDLGLHGRYSTTPARKVNDCSRWDGDEYCIDITGTIEECALFGDRIRLTRRITTQIGSTSLEIRDRVENFGYRPAPFMILYHINPGFPLLDADSCLEVPRSQTESYNEAAKANIDTCMSFHGPTEGFEEQCFSHTLTPNEQGRARAALVNRSIGNGLALFIDVDTSELPYLNEWKMMGQGDYVLGMEPSNCPLGNRAMMRARNQLPMLEPGEARDLFVGISIAEGDEAIGAQIG